MSERALCVPTESGNIPTVDSKGRVVLPKEVREELGLTPGTDVEIHEERGRVVVQPEDDPERILERPDALLADSPDRDPPPYDDLDPQSRAQVDAIRRQARPADTGHLGPAPADGSSDSDPDPDDG